MLHVIDVAISVKARVDRARHQRRIARLRRQGMHIGRDVNLPDTLYVDEEYCWLISVGDSTGFGPECMILAHDAGPSPAHTVRRIARVIVHSSCHFGARTIILPGVEIGPRTVVAANSVVSRSLPPDSVCAGSPARPFRTVDDYLDAHRKRIQSAPTFEYNEYSIESLTPERRAALVNATLTGDAYMVGGRTAELGGAGGLDRTPFEGYRPPPPVR